ncbi:hypothetical protein RQN30_07635 [Arcanobacterium hippocoleae]
MKKVFFAILTVVVGYLGFLKISERLDRQAIWQQATDDVNFSEWPR